MARAVVGHCPKCAKPYKNKASLDRHIAQCDKVPTTPPAAPPAAPAPSTGSQAGPKQFEFSNFVGSNQFNETYSIPAGMGQPGQSPWKQAPPLPGQQPGPQMPMMQGQPYPVFMAPWMQQQEPQGYHYSIGLTTLESLGDFLNDIFETKDFKFSTRQKEDLRKALADMNLYTEKPQVAVTYILLLAFGPPLLFHLDKKYDLIDKLINFLEGKFKWSSKKERRDNRGDPPGDPERTPEGFRIVRKPGDLPDDPNETVHAICRGCGEGINGNLIVSTQYVKVGCPRCSPDQWGLTDGFSNDLR